MRHFIAASALAAVAFSSTVSVAAAGPEQSFLAACKMEVEKDTKPNPEIRAQVPLMKVIMEASGSTACAMAWTKAKELTSLDASGKSLVDVNMLRGLTGLTSLNLSNNSVADLTPLETLTNLKKVDLSENQIADVAVLGKLTGLTSLNLSKNKVSDISGLSTLTALTELRLNDNEIVKVWPVTDMKALKKAYFNANKIENLSPLAKNKKLVELSVRGNPVKNCPDKGKVEVKGKEIDNTDLLKGVCKDEAWKKGGK